MILSKNKKEHHVVNLFIYLFLSKTNVNDKQIFLGEKKQ